MKAYLPLSLSLIVGGITGAGFSLLKNLKVEREYRSLSSKAVIGSSIYLLDWNDSKWTEVTPSGISVSENKKWCLEKAKSEEYKSSSKKARFLGRCTNIGADWKISL